MQTLETSVDTDIPPLLIYTNRFRSDLFVRAGLMNCKHLKCPSLCTLYVPAGVSFCEANGPFRVHAFPSSVLHIKITLVVYLVKQ